MRWMQTALAGVLVVLILLLLQPLQSQDKSFQVMEATISDVHNAYKSGTLTARQLVQLYLDRIGAYDQKGPTINSVININPKALEEAGRLDAAMRSGFVGPLHGIPVVLKDMIDAAGLPTTYGSSIMKNFVPARDAFVVEKLKKAGAIVLAKVTLGEFAGGDTYGSLFGETHNPYDLLRTVGGSSGGTGASVAANFSTVGIGQEGFASISRPAAWNNIVGLRPTPGLVSGGGLGPMTRTVADLATVLDVIAGYDPESPETALGVGQVPETYTRFLDANGLKGARIGILREPMGYFSEPQSADFQIVTGVFRQSGCRIEGRRRGCGGSHRDSSLECSPGEETSGRRKTVRHANGQQGSAGTQRRDQPVSQSDSELLVQDAAGGSERARKTQPRNGGV